jgi:hypothetical protein
LRSEIKRYLRNPRQSFPDILRDLDSLHHSRREGSELEEEMRSLEGSLGAWDGHPESLAALIDRCNQLQSDMESVPDPAGWLHALQSIPETSWSAASESLVAVQQALAVIGSLLELPDLIPVFPPDQPLDKAQATAERLSSNLGLLRDWCSFSQVWDQFSRSPLGPILSWEVSDEDWPSLPSLYKIAILKAWFNHCFDEHAQLREFDPERHDVLLENFRALESEYLEQSRSFVRAEVVARMPNRNLDVNGSELSEIKREMVKKRNRLPIRSLFTRIPTLLPLLKPCVLASPISVARFLPADGQSFDIVLFDEASQVETHDAIGAIARGRQVIIVGDNKQMPPTNFFSRSVSNADDLADPDCVDDLESILDESIACNLPEQTLTWHYRSRHQSLIAFSNDAYYENKLSSFPTPQEAKRESGFGIHFHHVSSTSPPPKFLKSMRGMSPTGWSSRRRSSFAKRLEGFLASR